MEQRDKQGLTADEPTFTQAVRSNAKFLRDCHADLSAAEAEVIAKKLDECADLIDKSSLPEVRLSDGYPLARAFHDTYERLAPQYGYETRADTKEFDPTTPNGKLMAAVCAEMLRLVRASDAVYAPADHVLVGCHCSPGRCMAPKIMGRQQPCLDPAKAAMGNDMNDSPAK